MRAGNLSEPFTLPQKAKPVVKRKKTSIGYIAIITGGITSIIGIIVLVGWQLENELLKSIIPNAVSMKANTAALFIVSGVTLILLQHLNRYSIILVRVLASIILVVGIQSLLQNLFGWDFGLNQILYTEPLGTIGTTHPGLMALYTSINFLLLGLVFQLFSLKTFRYPYLTLFSLIFPLTTSGIALVGYFSGFVELAGPVAYTKMAVHTAGAFFIISIGIIQLFRQRQSIPMPIEQKLFAGLTISGVIIIYISLFSISGIQSIHKSTDQTNIRYQTKQMLSKTLSLVVDFETNSRGYVLSGKDNYIDPMKSAMVELPVLLNNLNQRTIDNWTQHEKLNKLKQLINNRIDFSNLLENTRRTQGLEKAILLFNSGKGKVITDSISTTIAEMIALEDKHLSNSSNEERVKLLQAQKTIYLSILFQLALFTIIINALIKNIVKRKKTENCLHDTNEYLSNLFNYANAPIIVWEPSQNITRFNHAFETLSGYSANEVIGRGIEILFPEEQRESSLNLIKSTLSGDRWESVEIIIHRKDGESRTVLWNSANILDENGEVISTIAQGNDITLRKQAEHSLIRTSKRLETALHSSKAGTWDWDVINGHIVWSPQMFVLFDLDPLKTNASFDTWHKVLHPEDIEMAEIRISQALKEHTFLNSDYRIILPSGQIRWINATGEGIYDEAGNPAQMVGICIDITARKEAEEKILNQLNELQRWQHVTLNREDKNIELKREVNELLIRLNEPIRYPSQEIKSLNDKSGSAN